MVVAPVNVVPPARLNLPHQHVAPTSSLAATENASGDAARIEMRASRPSPQADSMHAVHERAQMAGKPMLRAVGEKAQLAPVMVAHLSASGEPSVSMEPLQVHSAAFLPQPPSYSRFTFQPTRGKSQLPPRYTPPARYAPRPLPAAPPLPYQRFPPQQQPLNFSLRLPPNRAVAPQPNRVIAPKSDRTLPLQYQGATQDSAIRSRHGQTLNSRAFERQY